MEAAETTILIIDDAREARRVLDTNLSHKGYKTLLAENGEQGMAILKDNQADLIMLDIIMPVMDGIETLAALKSAANLKDIPVIMITADESTDTAVECMQKGACSYITKPYDFSYVFKQIEHCLAHP